MRFFIALEIPNKNLAQFQAIQNSLHTLIPQVRLTALDKIHLTLAFLGEQNNELQEKLIEIIRNSVKDIHPFEVTPAYIDGFPNIHHPEVLWIGVKGDIDKVLLIREYIKDGLENLHLPVDERRFVPHITIAKANNGLKIDQNLEINLEKIMTAPFEPIQISSIKLYESVPEEPARIATQSVAGGGLHKHKILAEVKLLSS